MCEEPRTDDSARYTFGIRDLSNTFMDEHATLLERFPRCSLGFLPTPLVPLAGLTRLLDGPTLYMKRDDMTGLATGGNKTRKLEFLMAQALAEGCDTVVTAGAAQSNHCRQTAAAAAVLGLPCHLVLGGEAPPLADGLKSGISNVKLHDPSGFGIARGSLHMSPH